MVPLSGKLEGRSVSDRSLQGARVLTSSSPTASGCTLPVSDAMRSVQVLDDGLRLVPKGKKAVGCSLGGSGGARNGLRRSWQRGD